MYEKMTEQEMRDTEVPRANTIGELSDYIESLVQQEHDYGTCVYAMSMAATAAFNYVARRLGVAVGQAALVVVLALFHDAGDVPAQERS